ncbi:hypothetical protein BJ912DRAFT_989710 [Pholiota molesta]|nr:hypothetical protein BJ912DRAFT_989710 [Pholiota molesta]
MATRTVVSYDDITLPYDPPEPPSHSSKSHGQPPSKKRKKNNQKGKRRDSPAAKSASSAQRGEPNKYSSGSTASSNQLPPSTYPEGGEDMEEYAADEGEYEEDEEESRELTHEEIWDDSALVYAWESAMEEYQSYHGGEDAWKKEPVKKSPLWYNVPIDVSTKADNTPSAITPAIITPSIVPSATNGATEEDSKPLNFDTFVPSHDPSLENPVPMTENYVPDTLTGAMVSQDEAFQRALSAMYWGGYWTAMYHAQRQMQMSQANAPEPSAPSNNVNNVEEEEAEDEEDDENIEVDNDDFVPTQR